ncbi:MAG: aromatic amino acid lyase [Candidatus Krumholzibacteriota bacterium]|nr:aromatic amino acid lyase [Candidatus Krumholzibacteriota bacterium]
MSDTVHLDGKSLAIEDVLDIAAGRKRAVFARGVETKIARFRQGLERQLVERPDIRMYGINVGCGDLKDTDISPAAFEEYQERYIKAHNCATGRPISVEAARAMLVVRLNSFAKGHSGVRPETCRLMLEMINRDVVPEILEEGSVGASGDLVPLAMVGAVMLGLPQAKAYHEGRRMSARRALEAAGLEPIRLGAKEAMAITNGTTFMAALGIFALRDAERLMETATAAAALSLEAIRGEKDAFATLIHNARPHPGQKRTAAAIRRLVAGSRRMTAVSQRYRWGNGEEDARPDTDHIHETGRVRVQDRYSFRCVPQVHGPVLEAIDTLRDVLSIEINSAVDNPLVTVDRRGRFRSVSGGNFHGQPLAVAFDLLKLALASAGLLSNKRTFSMLDRFQSYGLPQDLAADPAAGDTGLMLAQYAAAARAAESRVLSTPASVTSISTSANQEDFVSMGSIGALHLGKVIYNTQVIVGVELLCALRALQMSEGWLPEKLRGLGKGTTPLYRYLDALLPPVDGDHYLKTDIDAVVAEVRAGTLTGLSGE